MQLQKILFPTDFSESAERALAHALELARRFESSIQVLHVRTPHEDVPGSPDAPKVDEDDYKLRVEKHLARLVGDTTAFDRVDILDKRNASVPEGILDYATEHGIEMIVMGTHGRTGISRFLLGSVAERVVRHAQCPVLTVAHHRRPYRNVPAYRTILGAFDFSDTSKEAIRQGKEFAETFDAEFDILYVIEQSVLPPFDDLWRASVRSEIPKVEGTARRVLSELLGSSFAATNLKVLPGNADGKAEGEIVDYAAKHDVDLIVMGTHGHSGWDHALLGSTTERVIRIAGCPVLTFHRAARTGAAESS